MTTTPGEASPHERDDTPAATPDQTEDAGAEVGMVGGEGSTFEPEEDPPAEREE